MNLYKNYNLHFYKKSDIILSFAKNEQYEEVDFDVLKNYAFETYDELCNKVQISAENRPKLELEYKDKLYTIGDNGEILISDMKEDDKTADTTNGYYTSEKNTIRINANQYNFSSYDKYGNYYEENSAYTINNYKKISEVIAHELEHANSAIIRNSIPEEQRKELVKEILLEKIKTGNESNCIIRTTDGSEHTMMIKPQMYLSERKDFAEIANKHLFSDTGELSSKMNEYYELKYKTENKSEKEINKIEELEFELYPLLKDIDDFISAHPNYTSNNYHAILAYKNKNENKKELLNYAIAIEERYQYFKTPEFEVETEELNNCDLMNVKKLISDNIEATEGNAILYSPVENKNIRNWFQLAKICLNGDDDYEQYFFGSEEVNARINAYQAQIDILSENKKENKAEIKKLEKTIKREKKSADLYKKKGTLPNTVFKLSKATLVFINSLTMLRTINRLR